MPKAPLSEHRQTVENMKVGISRYLVKRGLAVNQEIAVEPWGRRRADVLAMDYKGTKIVMVEVKSSKVDYTSDKKWHKYLPHCSQFYFAFTRQVWEKVEPHFTDDKRVGVLILDPFPNYWHYRVTVKRAARIREITQEKVLETALRLAYRGAKYRTLDDVYKGGNKR